LPWGADSKVAEKSKLQVSDLADGAEPQPSLGKVITEARERKGMSRDQVINEAHLPAHYVKMIETDNYDLISDRLYLVPFLRRYATFLGLDAEEVASRFVSNVQHAEANVVRLSQEITVVTRQPGRAARIAFVVLIVAVILLLGDFVWRRFVERGTRIPAAVVSPVAISPPAIPPAPRAPVASQPNQAAVGTNPQPALPVAAPASPIAPSSDE
jgi:cytoskeleton protein RodZ